MPLAQLLKTVTSKPAEILGLPQGSLAKGAPADLLLFDPEEPLLVDAETLQSRARNSAFDGRRMQGRVHRSFVGGENVFSRTRN
jgi:dihydroorotase